MDIKNNLGGGAVQHSRINKLQPGVRFNALMHERKVTSARLAEMSTVSDSTISKLRVGLRDIHFASLDVLISLADALNVPITALLDDERLAMRLSRNMKKEKSK